jgi:hypothetical protein
VSPRQLRALRLGVLTGVLLCLAVVAYALLRYPAILSPLGPAVAYLLIFAFIVAGYGAMALRGTRPATPAGAAALRYGTRVGLLTGCAWLLEVAAGNLFGAVGAHRSWVLALYYGATVTAFGLPVVAGALAARHSGDVVSGTVAGLWAGLVSGLMTFLGLMLVTFLFLAVLRRDPDSLREFQRSHAADLSAFLVGDSLAGAINHLWLVGPLLGAAAGTLGGAIGRQLPPRG